MINVSVIIPVYGVEKFLQACIDSLIAQSMDNIEFIFVNDASPDNSLEILLENQRKYPDKIRVIDLKQNVRQGGARNKGLEYARGEYIGFVDSDDMILPNMYEDLYNCVLETGADAVFCRHSRINENFGLDRDFVVPNNLKKSKWNKKLSDLDNKELDDNDRMKLIVYPFGGVWSGIWRKDILVGNNIFFPEKLKYEDNYWSTLVCCYLNKVAFVDKVGYLYRKNMGSTVNVRNNKSHFDRLEVERLLFLEMEQRNLISRFHDVLEYIYTFRYVFNSIHVITSRFDEPNTDMIVALIHDLKVKFPLWYNNRFWVEMKSKRARTRCILIAKYTKCYCRYIVVKNRIKSLFRSF